MDAIFPEFTEYISPDGITFHFEGNDRFLISEEGLGMPPISYITRKGPFQHGESLIDFRLGTRIVQLILQQDSENRYKYWERRAELMNMLRPNRQFSGYMNPGILQRRLPNGSIRSINVVIEQGPIFAARSTSMWTEASYTETLRFIAHDPVFFDPIQKGVLWDTLADPLGAVDLVFPMEFPFELGGSAFGQIRTCTYPGTWLSYPYITLTGPINGFTITNAETGEIIDFSYSIAVGEIVYIDLAWGHKSVENNLGVNLIGSVTTSSDLATFHIAPDPEAVGGINTFTITGSSVDANSRVLLEYYERYIGI